MKILVIVAQVILDVMFFVTGLNGFLPFLHAQMPGGDAGEFLAIVTRTHYGWLVEGTQVVAGVLLIVNRFVTLALVLAAALIANILTFHATMNPSGAGMAIFVAVLWLFLAWRYRANFEQLLASKPIPAAPANEKAAV